MKNGSHWTTPAVRITRGEKSLEGPVNHQEGKWCRVDAVLCF